MNMFVDPARAKEFECVLCLDIYKDPVQLGCEDHIFCKQCIDQLISINGHSFRCPLCKVQCTSNDVTRVKFVGRQIGDLKVKCPNTTTNKKFIGSQTNENKLRRSTRLKVKEDTKIGKKRERTFDNINHNKRRKLNENASCEWQGSYSELDNHIKKCPLQFVSCEHCSISILRRELNEHYDKCTEFPLQCMVCYEEDIARNDMALHISMVCPMTIINCDDCKQQIVREVEIYHLENQCPESLIKCAFYKFGCKDKLKRKDEKKHIENAAFTHNHLVQIANHQLKLKNEIKSLNEKLDNTVNELKNENKLLKDKINGLEVKQIQSENRMSGMARHYNNAKIVYVMEGKFWEYHHDMNDGAQQIKDLNRLLNR